MSTYAIDNAKESYLNQFYQTLLSLVNVAGKGVTDIPAPRLKLIALTRVKIDEMMAQAEGIQFSLPESDNSNVIDIYINAILDESAKHLLQTAPYHIIRATDGSEIETNHVVVEGHDSPDGFIYLPEDYLRMVGFKIAGWLTEASEPITTRDKKYSHQKTFLKGGKAKPVIALNSVIKVNSVSAAQVDVLTFSSTIAGSLDLTVGSITRRLNYTNNWTSDLTSFVTSAFTGVTITHSGNTLIFTANDHDLPLPAINVLVVSGDAVAFRSTTVPFTPAREMKRILEYYSDPSGAHVLEKFNYIALTGAEGIQSNLYDALTWLCASKILQIWGQVAGTSAYADRAMAQVELSYKNLL